MKRDQKKIPLLFIMFLGWMLLTILFVYVGYVITAAIYPLENESYATMFFNILINPSVDYLNKYTPIGMIVGFIFSEVFLSILLFICSKSARKKAEGKLKLSDEILSKDTFIETELKKSEELCDNMQEQGTIDYNKAGMKDEIAITNLETECEMILQEKTFLELFNKGYSMAQINEMMELTKYIKNIEVGVLAKMFEKNMKPEEIRSKIESFYG